MWLHPANCPVWVTADARECTCAYVPAWRIRKEPGEEFPWRVWRRTDDMTYAPLLRASTWGRAVALIKAMNELQIVAAEQESRG